MLGPFTTASHLTPIQQMSLAVLSRAVCAPMSTTTPTTTTTRDRGDRCGPMEWAQLNNPCIVCFVHHIWYGPLSWLLRDKWRQSALKLLVILCRLSPSLCAQLHQLLPKKSTPMVWVKIYRGTFFGHSLDLR